MKFLFFGALEIEINAKMHAHTHADKWPIDISNQMKKKIRKKIKYRRKESQRMVERVNSAKETEMNSNSNNKKKTKRHWHYFGQL